jgi:hypothetical protein
MMGGIWTTGAATAPAPPDPPGIPYSMLSESDEDESFLDDEEDMMLLK